MKRTYTQKQLEFLREGYLSMQVPELTIAFNERFGTDKSEAAIKSCLTKHGFTCGRPTGLPKGTFTSYTQEQAQFIIDNYAGRSVDEMTGLFNDTFGTGKSSGQIRAFVKNHKVRSGRTGHFPQGHQPWNTGTKGLTGTNSGSFKKGQQPVSQKPIGYERISRDGYIEIKIAETNPYTGHKTRFKQKHVVIWEEAHGPIPKGLNLRFLDGNKQNCSLDNLELITRAEHLHLNRIGYNQVPDEFKPTMRTVAKIEVACFQQRKRA